MSPSDSQNGLATSFTDLMTSLAVIFILLLCVTHNEAQQEGETTRNSILAELRNELREFMQKGVKIESDPKDPLGLLVLVPEGLFAFEFDKADIPPKGTEFLRLFIPRFASIVCDKRFRDDINSIVVEGHTDSTGTDQYNWELSQRRSMSVVAKSLNVLDENHQDNNNFTDVRNYFVKLISASGRGSAELIKINGIENRELSRRVVFKIRVRSLEQRLVKTIVQ